MWQNNHEFEVLRNDVTLSTQKYFNFKKTKSANYDFPEFDQTIKYSPTETISRLCHRPKQVRQFQFLFLKLQSIFKKFPKLVCTHATVIKTHFLK